MPEIELLSDAEYAELGFRSGLEIHQQLDTCEKLFCRCPVGLTDSEPDMRILRHMRPTLSELGEYDGTALMEFKTRKQVVYELFSDRTCTYEMDDTPPFPLNRQALEIAIEIALLLRCRIVDEVHVTRKQYLDGSIPTGFQRTAVIGVDGWIPYKGRRIRVAMLTLEEDACREVSDVGHEITFKTDRLSTPLAEVITYPDMRTPREVAEVNRLLGDLMRATCKVRRGIGSVRQDVNVSIAGGDRVEIKGVPKIGYVRALTHYEALRQKALLELRDECRRRGLRAEKIAAGRIEARELLAGTKSEPLRRALDEGGAVAAIRLRGCAGLFGRLMQPGLDFADEVSGRIRVVACIDRLPNLLHSDDEQGSGLAPEEWRGLRKALGATEGDLVAMVFGNPEDAHTAAGEVEIRMREALDGVPRETRQAFPDGRTGFERILPGPDRMYPDTDTPPTAVQSELIERIKASMPEQPWERERRYGELGLGSEVARLLSRSRVGDLFDELAPRLELPAATVAGVLLRHAGNAGRSGPDLGRLGTGDWQRVLALLQEGIVSREKLPELLERVARREDLSPEEALSADGFACVAEPEVDAAVEEEVGSWSRRGNWPRGKAERYLVGRVMRRIGKRYPGAEVARKIGARLDQLGIEVGEEGEEGKEGRR